MSVDSASDTFFALLTFLLILSPALLHVLAYAGERSRALRVATVVLLGAFDVFAAMVGALLAISPAVLDLATMPPPSPDASPASTEALVAAIGSLGTVLLVAALAGLLLLVPAARRILARVVPIDPSRLVHAVALHDALLLVIVSAAIALVIPVVLADPEGLDMLSDNMASGGLAVLWIQNAAFALLAVFGVGWLVARDGRAVIARLGLDQPLSIRWWFGGVAVALGASLLLDAIWGAIAPEQMADVERLSEALIEPILAFGWAGAFTIGAAAGIGEELLFRGAAQPRFGLLLTSLLFAVLHTQYSVSPALILIFVLALILGVARQRAGTWTAIAVHATYNFVIAAMALLGGT